MESIWGLAASIFLTARFFLAVEFLLAFSSYRERIPIWMEQNRLFLLTGFCIMSACEQHGSSCSCAWFSSSLLVNLAVILPPLSRHHQQQARPPI